jgi:hypothetical protein
MKIRCKDCNIELESHPIKTRCCGCPNMTTIRGDVISAVDMTKVIMVESNQARDSYTGLTNQDLMWQEERKKRGVRKLTFEVK